MFVFRDERKDINLASQCHQIRAEATKKLQRYTTALKRTPSLDNRCHLTYKTKMILTEMVLGSKVEPIFKEAMSTASKDVLKEPPEAGSLENRQAMCIANG